MGDLGPFPDFRIDCFDDPVEGRQDLSLFPLAAEVQEGFVRFNLLSNSRQIDLGGRTQNFLGEVVQSEAHPAARLQSHPGMAAMQEVGDGTSNTEDFMYPGFFRSQEKIELLFKELIKRTLMAEI